MKKIAIITAGGVGSRMHLEVPKQFYEVNGKPLILYTLLAFQKNENITDICLVYLDGYLDYFKKLIADFNLSKVHIYAKGGATNQLSIYEGLKAIQPFANDKDIVLVHDGIRPLVDDDVINDCIDVCNKFGNAVAVIPSNEAMLISENGLDSNISIARTKVWKTQTPHAMFFGDMFRMMSESVNKGITSSVAICTLLIETGHTVHFSKGNDLNFKLTTKEDIDLFKGILNAFEK